MLDPKLLDILVCPKCKGELEYRRDTPELPPPPPAPLAVQVEALRALEETREEGNTAGLVVLATGLGKTWLSAFDSQRPEFRRILFVAHREEILDQSLATFRYALRDAAGGPGVPVRGAEFDA